MVISFDRHRGGCKHTGILNFLKIFGDVKPKKAFETFIMKCIIIKCILRSTVVVVVVYFILSRLLYLAYSANLGLLCMPHPGIVPLV